MVEGLSYREDFQLWWPDYDHKPIACHNRVMTRVKDVDAATKRCKQKRYCIQAGGHAGLWPHRLGKQFKWVYTFECEPILFECMRRNIASTSPNVVMSQAALGPKHNEVVMMKPHVSAGSWRIDEEKGSVPVRQITIDALDLQGVDCIILDVEGYEPRVLWGARETIARDKPVIMVEMLPESQQRLTKRLDGLGYKMVDKVHADQVWVPK